MYIFPLTPSLPGLGCPTYCTAVVLIGRTASLVASSTHENTPYLPGIKLSELIEATTEVSVATEGAEIVFIVVPTPFVRGEGGREGGRQGGQGGNNGHT